MTFEIYVNQVLKSLDIYFSKEMIEEKAYIMYGGGPPKFCCEVNRDYGASFLLLFLLLFMFKVYMQPLGYLVLVVFLSILFLFVLIFIKHIYYKPHQYKLYYNYFIFHSYFINANYHYNIYKL